MNKIENSQMNVDISRNSGLLSRKGKATKCQTAGPEDITVKLKKKKEKRNLSEQKHTPTFPNSGSNYSSAMTHFSVHHVNFTLRIRPE